MLEYDRANEDRKIPGITSIKISISTLNKMLIFLFGPSIYLLLDSKWLAIVQYDMYAA